MLKRIVGIGVAFALSAAAFDASALSQASAQLSDFHIELFSFGSAAPSVTFTAVDGSLAHTTTFSALTGLATEDQQSGGSVLAGVVSSSPFNGGFSSHAAIGGDFWLGAGKVLASAFVAPGYDGTAEATAYLADGTNYATFTLSPDTLMVMSAMADLRVQAGSASLEDYAVASADLVLSGSEGDSAQASGAHSLVIAGGLAATQDTRHMQLAISFANPFAHEITGSFFGGVDATAVSTAPEPGNVLLLAAGLLVVGAGMTRKPRGLAAPRCNGLGSKD